MSVDALRYCIRSKPAEMLFSTFMKRLIPFLIFFVPFFVSAETIKTDVLVIGGGPVGVAAAIQASRSGVKTLLIESSGQLGGFLSNQANKNYVLTSALNVGIWAEIYRRIQETKKIKTADSLVVYKLSLNPEVNAAVIKNITDTVKNLTVKLSSGFKSIKKEGKYWNVVLDNGQEIRAYAVIDAMPDARVATSAKAVYSIKSSGENVFKTSTAGLSISPYQVPISWFLPRKGVENIFATELVNAQLFKDDKTFRPETMMTGQTVGVLAAYVAFFKTDNTKLNIRIVQNELLTYKSIIVWYADVSLTDVHKTSIQHTSVTGLLKPDIKDTLPYFLPDSSVKSSEIKPVLSEIYTRTFLWFNKNKPGPYFTVANMLSLISEFTLTDPDNLKRRMAIDWKEKYKFTSDYNLSKQITRREFAVLSNVFLKPFDRRVDESGKLIN